MAKLHANRDKNYMFETEISHKSRCAGYKEHDIFARFRLCLLNPFSKTQNKKNNKDNNSNSGSSGKNRLISTMQTRMREEEPVHTTAARGSGDPIMLHMVLSVPVVSLCVDLQIQTKPKSLSN